ncbi:LacI family DNA-binding transcriptional regulator [Gulosibacter faecalis]|jgi:DNA-binding LacI/PurR family transcriptional regulator|uniref:LacI family DNA-binding transcriptional regulator n=1 Tax=Gulosibacter faecalis TaxID=272240 RepID=A0ABW5UY99_9MICO|nr:LacI family DNA-binding transcriptional regulator [Gulosibacter faecalis]
MEKTGATIIDIARSLGISKTAVSAALHGGGRVSESTRIRVLDEARRMGYVSNRAAQRLRGGRHGAIGLSVPADVGELSFYMELAFGAASAAAEAGSDLLLLADAPAGARRPSLDGVIIVDPTPESFGPLAERVASAPIVTVGEYRGDDSDRVAAWIAADHVALVGEVLDGIVMQGARTPALIGLPEDREPAWAHDVSRGYSAWCAARGVTSTVVRLSLDPDEDDLRRTLGTVRDTGCDSVVWVAQSLVLRALAADLASGLIMATMAAEPGTLGLVGADLRAREYGRSAARLLLAVLEGEVLPGTHEVHEARVVLPT